MMLIKKLFFMLPIIFMFSCHTEKRQSKVPTPPGPGLCSGTINYASNCTVNGACQLSFTCNGGLQAHSSDSLFSIVKKMTHFQATSSEQFTITSITTTNTPALLQASVGAVPTTWFSANSPLDCTVDSSSGSVSCANFAPLADDFTITGTLGSLSVSVDVTVDTSGFTSTPKEQNGATTGGVAICGQFGIGTTPDATHYTTAQRMYDCSKRIGNFAGYGNGDGTFTNFIAGNQNSINSSWFVVTCPPSSVAGSGNPDKCSWLSPLIPSSRATGANEYLSTVNGSQGALMSTLENKRILWSGILTIAPHTSGGTSYGQDRANFFEANGNNPWTPASPATYDYYFYNTSDPNAGLTIKTWTTPICAPDSSGGTCTGNGVIDSVYFSVGFYPANYPNTSTPAAESLCEQYSLTNDAMIPVSAYNWEVPSYPMIMTITGGINNGNNNCEPTNGGNAYTGNQEAYCLTVQSDIIGGSQYLGLRAIDPIPSFSTSFWSSSVDDADDAWVFFDDGSVFFNGLNSDDVGVRCVSAASDLF